MLKKVLIGLVCAVTLVIGVWFWSAIAEARRIRAEQLERKRETDEIIRRSQQREDMRRAIRQAQIDAQSD